MQNNAIFVIAYSKVKMCARKKNKKVVVKGKYDS